MSSNLWLTASSLLPRQSATFKDLTIETLTVEDIDTERFTLGESLLPRTGGIAIIGNGSKPFLNIQAINYTGSSATFSTGIFLGATGSIMNSYKFDSQTNTYSGIWASPQSITLKFCKVGNQCTVFLPSAIASANAGGFIVFGTAIPIAFRPENAFTSPVTIEDNGSTGSSPGMALFSTNGQIVISKNYASAPFTGSGNSGVLNGFYVTYTTA